MKSVKKKTIIGVALATAFTLTAGVTTVFAVHDLNTFELDRNAIDSNGAATPPDDWDTVNLPLPNGAGGHAFAWSGVLSDPVPESNIFTTGGSKDDNDVDQWKWKEASNILDKDNITNAYAAAYNVNNELVIYFGLDRFSNSGSAQVGFWFFRGTIGLNANGTFSGVHQNGDVLVQSNFSQGGTVDSVSVFEWLNGALVPIATGGDCVGGVGAGDTVCATVNQGPQTAPWPYSPKPNEGTPGIFPQGTFFEGGINLTSLGLTDACFSSFLAETRASTPFNSVLKDFVGPHEFETCSIGVTKSCTNPRLNAAQDMIIYDISGTVTASGFGSTLFNIGLSDNPPADGAFAEVACDDDSMVLDSFPLDSLAGTTCYKNTITVPLNMNGLSDTVTVTANTASDGTGTALTDSATATCPNLMVSPAIRVRKNCEAAVEVLSDKVVAKVTVFGDVCNIGDSNLSNVTVDDQNESTTPDPLVNGVSLSTPADPANPTVAEGACVEYSGAYYPSVANDVNDNPTTCAGDVVFKDTVEATATDIFNQSVTPHTDMADCPLCFDCPEPEPEP